MMILTYAPFWYFLILKIMNIGDSVISQIYFELKYAQRNVQTKEAKIFHYSCEGRQEH